MLFHGRTRLVLRGSPLLLTVYAVTYGFIRLAWSVAAGPIRSLRGQPTMLALDEALLGLSATLVAACAGWLAVLATAVVVDAVVRANEPSPSVCPGRLGALCPPAFRRMILAGCGAALCAGIGGPAFAGSSLDGLTVPDRAAAPQPVSTPVASAPAASGPTVVRVRTGDSLWALAAQRLPPDATERQVDARWREVYRLNAERIGADPNLVFPGTTLRLPPGATTASDTTDTTDREERP